MNIEKSAVASIVLGLLFSAASAGGAPAELKFRDFFKMPVGPRGLEPSGKLLGLDGRLVRIVGYMAQEEAPIGDRFYLTPFPVLLGQEDEPLADDLPASMVSVHAEAGGKPIPHLNGLLRLTGRLAVGPREEADGRVSDVRLFLDSASSLALLAGSPDPRGKPAGDFR